MYDAGTTFTYQGLTYTVISEKIRSMMISAEDSNLIGPILASPMQLAVHESPYSSILIRIDDEVKMTLTDLAPGYILDPDAVAVDENGVEYSKATICLSGKCCLNYFCAGDGNYYDVTFAGDIMDTNLHLS